MSRDDLDDEMRRDKLAAEDLVPSVPRPEPVSVMGMGGSWWGIVTVCDKESGYAKVKRAEGTLPNLTVVSGAEEQVVWGGIEPPFRVDMPVLLVPNGPGVTPAYSIDHRLKGLTWTEPEAGDLAPVQDDGGGQCSDCCDETVSTPT